MRVLRVARGVPIPARLWVHHVGVSAGMREARHPHLQPRVFLRALSRSPGKAVPGAGQGGQTGCCRARSPEFYPQVHHKDLKNLPRAWILRK